MPKKKMKLSKKLLIAGVSLVAVFVIVSNVLCYIILSENFTRVNYPTLSSYPLIADFPELTRQTVTFESDGNILTGYIYGGGNAKGLVVISHGLGGGADSYLIETQTFIEDGFTVFAFDNTGSYHSEGESTRGLPQSVIDLDAALTFINEQPDLNSLPVLLYGHSWGGYAVTAVLNFNHRVNAAVSVAGYNKPIELLTEQAGQMIGWFGVTQTPFLAFQQWLTFGGDAGLTAVDGINKSGIPVMLVHGRNDELISATGAGTINHINEITNPNVITYWREDEGRDGHNTLFVSEAAAAYINEMDAKASALREEHGSPLPQSVREAYYAEIDRMRMTELDEEYVEEILKFFNANL